MQKNSTSRMLDFIRRLEMHTMNRTSRLPGREDGQFFRLRRSVLARNALPLN